MNKLYKAIQEFNKTVAENTKAQKALNAAENDTCAAFDTYAKNGGLRDPEKRAAYDEILKVNAKAEKAAKQARAVLMASGQNVANIAANIWNENSAAFSDPVYFKKFKTAFEKLFDPELFYFDSGYGYSMYIYFRVGEYGHNSAYVASIENGAVVWDDGRDRKHAECTLAEIKKEARRAFTDAEKLRKAVDAIKTKDARKNYKSAIQYYMPYLEVGAIHDEYRLF